MKILLAEDDDVSRMLLSDILTSEPELELVAVADGAAAWSALEQQSPFDAAIFDVMMPELSGLDLVARLRGDRRFSELPVIMCTALNDRATVTEAASHGISHYIVKPYSRVAVLEKVRELVSLRRADTALEPAEVVCARLGIQVDTWHAMLAKLEANINRWIADARQALRVEHLKALALRANALQGAAVNLGAGPLAVQLTDAEAALNEIQSHVPTSRDVLLSDPMVLSELNSVAESVGRENQMLRNALNSGGKTAPR